jgi:catechol 2,3-dioxygenase-like lactoylglutathione lyase family enzyme
MKTFGLIEVILYVKDMNKMVHFYSEVLDLPPATPGKREFSSESRVTFQTGSCTLALHSGGNGNTGPDAPKIVFQVEDIKSARFQLLQASVAVSDIRSPAAGIQVCDAKDPEGNLFSIEELKNGQYT